MRNTNPTNRDNVANATTNNTPTATPHGESTPAPVYLPAGTVAIFRDEYKNILAFTVGGNVQKLTLKDIKNMINNPRERVAIKEKAREILDNIEREEKREKAREENFNQCIRIADTLDEIAEGLLYICPACGCYHNPAEAETHENEDGATVYTCPACGEEIEEDTAEQVSVFDYFADCLDIEYITDSEKNFLSVRVCIAWGGPSIHVDTRYGEVRLNWWTETASASLSRGAVDMVDEFGRAMFGEF